MSINSTAYFLVRSYKLPQPGRLYKLCLIWPHNLRSTMLPDTGTILISSPTLKDDFFNKAVLLITQYNKQGAMGFVINQPYSRPLNQLQAFTHLPPVTLYHGGPVDNEHLFMLHRQPALIQNSQPVTPELWMGGLLEQAAPFISNSRLGNKDIKLLIGYCGWDAGELEAEIEEGSWLIVNAHTDIIFTTTPYLLWQQLLDESK
jgi:putative transcriptional regulator